MRQPCTQTLAFVWLQRVVTFKLTTEGVWFSWEEVAVTVKLGSWEAGLWADRSLGTTAILPRGCSSALRECLPPVDPVPCSLSPCACPHISSVSTHSQQVSTPPVWPVLPWRLPSSLCGQVSLILPIRCLGRPSRIQSLHFSLFFVVSRHVCFLVGLNVKLMGCDHYGSWRTVFNIPLSTVLLVPTSLCRLPALSVPAPAPMPSSRNGDVYLFETRSFLAA